MGSGFRVQGYFAHTKRPPPQDLHRALGIGLPQGPRGGQFLMSEVPLYSPNPLHPLENHADTGSGFRVRV